MKIATNCCWRWFHQDYSICKTFNYIIFQPLCRVLGANQAKKDEIGDWVALQLFFCMKIKEIKFHPWKNNLGYGKKVVEAIECLLSKQTYFNKDVSEETKELMLKAPMVTRFDLTGRES